MGEEQEAKAPLYSSLTMTTCNFITGFENGYSHFPALILFSLLVSVVFGVLSKHHPANGSVAAPNIRSTALGVALVLGWIMYPAP